jgi:(heptosyl)LPS beta-1,4-glucosyltransferase
MSEKVMAAILTKNEARHIEGCIRSVGWTDGVILSDSYSTDGTVDLARSLGAEVMQSPFINFAEQRNRTLAQAQSLGADWVFFIDADERSSPEMGNEIRRVLAGSSCVGWWVPRYNYIVGHRMRGGGWYPDAQLRVLRVGMAHYDPKQIVHETVVLSGEAGTLEEHLVHYNYDSLTQFRQKQDRYALFEAEMLHREGVHPRPWTYVTMPLREFWRRYVSLRGYLDGIFGFYLCALMAWYKFRAYVEVARLHREGETPAP